MNYDVRPLRSLSKRWIFSLPIITDEIGVGVMLKTQPEDRLVKRYKGDDLGPALLKSTSFSTSTPKPSFAHFFSLAMYFTRIASVFAVAATFVSIAIANPLPSVEKRQDLSSIDGVLTTLQSTIEPILAQISEY